MSELERLVEMLTAEGIDVTVPPCSRSQVAIRDSRGLLWHASEVRGMIRLTLVNAVDAEQAVEVVT